MISVKVSEVYEPEHLYVFRAPCMVCQEEYEVRVPGPALFRYNQGEPIQSALSMVPAEDREFLLSGISPKGWKMMFGDDE